MTNDKPDTLDALLDAAVASYSNTDPLAGLEQRVLQRVRAHGRTRRLWWWLRAAGLAAGGCAALVLLASWTRPITAPQRVMLLPNPQVPVLTPVAQPRPVSARRKAIPEVAPPTSEERALMALVEQAPDETRQAFLDLQRHSEEPIRVDEIKIEPLQRDGSR